MRSLNTLQDKNHLHSWRIEELDLRSACGVTIASHAQTQFQLWDFQQSSDMKSSSMWVSWTYQPSQPRSPAPPCWIWSGYTWMGMESLAPLFPAGAGSLWLGQYVRSLQWTRRGEPSPIPYSQDSPQWCWLYSPQWLACTQSHPGKGKSRTLTRQAELSPQRCSVPLMLQLILSIKKNKHLYVRRKEKGCWMT